MTRPSPIAVVGLAGALPGSSDLDGFWDNVAHARSAARPVPAGRWPVPAEALLGEAPVGPDRLASVRACLLDPAQLELGDRLIGTPLEGAGIERLDPLVRLALRVGIDAWRSAETDALDPARAGVILANIALPTEESSRLARGIVGRAFEGAVLGANAPLASDTTLGSDPRNRYVTGLPAGLLGRALGLGGGGFTLDAACASSLYALHLACEELRAGRLDAVLAGGVSRPDSLYTQVGFSQLRALSPTGTCAPFTPDGDGLVVGEGAGIFVLKRLEDARAQGDRIHGLITAVGLSNDVGGSLLSPETEGQQRAMAQAYERAGWSPSDLDLVEGHGTGTARGDSVEARSLVGTWGDSDRPCVLGSVKSNVGHLLTAAGAAGFLKVLLALRHQTLPPTANARGETVAALDGSPFEVLTEAKPWADPGRARRAAVSGFGFGGINAHLLVEEFRDQDAAPLAPPAAPDIAVVGLGVRVGAVQGVPAFAQAGLTGASALGPVPEQRWRGLQSSPWVRSLAPDLDRVPGAWIDRLSLPVGRFKLPPNEAPQTLAQQLLMLQVAAEAADDAGLSPARGGAALLRTGVIVGLAQDLEATGFHLGWLLRAQARRWAELEGETLTPEAEAAWVDALQSELGPRLDATRTLGALGGIVASRVARELRLGGPSFGVSSEEASGLRALEVAARLLQRGEVDRMLVGAVDLAGDLRSVLAGDALQPWTRRAPRPFDPDADGAAVGEGGAALVLKRLDDALRDGDRIYGVLKGVGASQDGWADAFARAEQEAGFGLEAVGLVEAGARGVPSEDRAELEAIAAAASGPERSTALAALAATCGDAGAASALLSLVRGLLALHSRRLPPLPGAKPMDDPQALHLAEQPQAWLHDAARGPRRLAVHARSVDGTRVQALLEEAPTPRRADLAPTRAAGLLLAWGEDAVGLARSVDALRRLCDSVGPSTPADELARVWFAEVGAPPPGAWVRAVAGTDASGIRRRLDRERSPTPAGEVAFVFPGSGAHHLGMGVGLLSDLPELHDRLAASTEHLASQHGVAALHPRTFGRAGGWRRRAEEALDRRPLDLIFGHVSHGIAVADALTAFAPPPDAALGYSLGESTALLALGVWPDRDAMWDDVRRSPLFATQLAGPRSLARAAWGDDAEWSVAAVPADADSVRSALIGNASLMIVNAPGECVVGGPEADVVATLSALDLRGARLRGVPTVHTPLVAQVEGAYRTLHTRRTVAVPGLRVYSGHRAQAYVPDTDACADSIVANAVHGLDFAATVLQAWDDGVRVFVECGPGSSCTRMIGRILGDRPHRAVSADRAGVPGSLALFEALAVLAEAGQPIDLARLYPKKAERSADVGPTVEVVLGGPAPQPPSLGAFLAGRRPAPAVAPAPRPAPAPSVAPAPRAAAPAPRPAAPAPRAAAAPVAPSPSGFAALVARHQALVAQHAAAAQATAAAHGAFLEQAQRSVEIGTRLLARTQGLAGVATHLPAPAPAPPAPPLASAPAPRAPVLDRAQCMEFAVGSVGAVLGPMFAPADAYPTRVRLPDEPLMLVDRITELEGEPGSMGSGRVVTEHDVLPGAWYLDGGRAPVCISVEAGQADLFLSGWLGIDLQTKGERVYRLLDARVTFWRDLPRVGETVRYDIRIDRFIRQGSTWLFFFRFEGWIGDEHLITMEDGCAGFFSPAQLASGRGLVDELPTDLPPRRQVDGRPTDPFTPLVDIDGGPDRLDDAQVEALRTGDLAAAFGPMFAGRRLAPALCLPGGRMKLVHRVTRLDPRGGTFGLGLVVADTDVDPQAWYLTCHFVDDMVMPGTLMYEGCLHTLRVLLLRLGWAVPETGADVHGAPIPTIGSALRCRGQVLDTTTTLTYEIHLKEIGYDPAPYVLADAVMYADGKRVVSFANVSYRIEGMTQADLVPAGDQPWERGVWAMTPLDPAAAPPPGRPALYDSEHILAFAVGKPSEAFGPPYLPFDADRRIARLPGPPFCFVDRVVHLEPEPWRMQPGGWIEAEYDAPPDAWYYAANRSRSMPFAVILETALQPCGWLAGYLGSALRADVDVHFRNLEGEATLHHELRTDAGTLTVRVRLTGASEAGGMIIQTYDMQLWQQDRLAYDGWTRFGFFPTASLKNQVGIRDAGDRLFVPTDPGEVAFELPREAPLDPDGCGLPPAAESLSLPAGAFQTIDRVTACLDAGGPANLGWIRGTFDVRPDDWFFAAHFFQDPVIPGSLGLESFLQLLKILARRRYPDLVDSHRFEPIAVGRKHAWFYRGQVIPEDAQVTVEAWVTSVEEGPEPVLVASGFLHVDGRTIYEMRGFPLRLVRA